jgi:hypothetical protein
VYNDRPYRENLPAHLVIEAENLVEAIVVAFDHLTRRGKIVCPRLYDRPERYGVAAEVVEAINARLAPFASQRAETTDLREFAPYDPAVKGRVLEQSS